MQREEFMNCQKRSSRKNELKKDFFIMKITDKMKQNLKFASKKNNCSMSKFLRDLLEKKLHQMKIIDKK